MQNRQRGNEATGRRVTLAGLAALAMLASLALAPAQGQTVEWQPQHPSYRHASQVISAWATNDTAAPVDVVLPLLEINYAEPLTLAVEQGVFWRSDPPSNTLADLILWTELDDTLLPWAELPVTPWPWGESVAPWAATTLLFTPGPVTHVRAWAQFTLRPGETVVVGQFVQAQALVLSTPEVSSLTLLGLSAVGCLLSARGRRTRR